MNATIRTQQAPESYATFWEPLVGSATPTTGTTANQEPTRARDAYLEFTEITEGVPAATRGTGS